MPEVMTSSRFAARRVTRSSDVRRASLSSRIRSVRALGLPLCDDCSSACGCGLSLAAGGVLVAALSFAGCATSGVDDPDMIGTVSDDVVVLAAPALDTG